MSDKIWRDEATPQGRFTTSSSMSHRCSLGPSAIRELLARVGRFSLGPSAIRELLACVGRFSLGPSTIRELLARVGRFSLGPSTIRELLACVGRFSPLPSGSSSPASVASASAPCHRELAPRPGVAGRLFSFGRRID